ncbi:MAG: hypothetical protein AABX85_00085 [Nanoarchaeota archaeon]
MILKIHQTAFEYETNKANQIYLQRMTHDLLSHKITGLTHGFIIPDDLIAELESFIKRNSLNRLVLKEDCAAKIHECCPRCLKAHMIKKAEEMGISYEGKEFLVSFMKGEVGHNSYYLDKDKLIKI